MNTHKRDNISNTKTKTLISIVVPAYNEEETLDPLFNALKKLMEKEKKYDFEVIIVEHGSTDKTYEKLLSLNKQDKRFKGVRLTRNFTCDGGITAGLAHATGDAAVIVYADLQDPPEIIHTFLRKWEKGYLNVYGVVKKRKDKNWIRTLNSKMFYWVLDKLTGGVIPKNVSDFRLVDKSVYQAINNIPERNRILRGLFAWTGAQSIGVEYNRKDRVAGQSKSYVLYTLKFALTAIFSFSYFPLHIITGFGILLSFFSFIALVIWTVKFIFWGVPFDGFGTLVGLMLLLFGFVFFMMGIMGKYIAMIFEEVKGRPNFIVRDTIGLIKKEGK